MDRVVMETFVKEANVLGLAGQLGSRVIGLGTRAATALGQRGAYGQLMRQGAQAAGGGKALAQNVGLGTAGLGLAGLGAGAGMVAGRASR